MMMDHTFINYYPFKGNIVYAFFCVKRDFEKKYLSGVIGYAKSKAIKIKNKTYMKL